ncbi:MAG: hypothetical protein LAO08_01695 [Acidobacteriia bacterium]|nr:hypothetical protein [Terriglobia bacterium]
MNRLSIETETSNATLKAANRNVPNVSRSNAMPMGREIGRRQSRLLFRGRNPRQAAVFSGQPAAQTNFNHPVPGDAAPAGNPLYGGAHLTSGMARAQCAGDR